MTKLLYETTFEKSGLIPGSDKNNLSRYGTYFRM